MSLSLVSASTNGFESLSTADLQQLQAEQFYHDETYHREIARLPVQQRITHMTLHFAKYCGGLMDNENDEQRTLADIFIIALSSANILGLALSPSHSSDTSSIEKTEFLRRFMIATGKMSAACEKLDHLEDYPFKAVLRNSVSDIAQGVIEFAAKKDWNLRSMVKNRLEGVRGRAFLPDRLT